MYRTFVVSALLFDSLHVLVLPLFLFLFYLFIRYTGGMKPRNILLVFVLNLVVFGSCAVAGVYDRFPYLYDYARYLQQGDAYVRETVCQPSDAATRTVVTNIIGAQSHWYCADGIEHVSRYQPDFPLLSRRWAQARLALRARYLPRSHLILEAAPTCLCPTH